MAKFVITVVVECDTLEEAEQVANERLNREEEYGFNYFFEHWSVWKQTP